MNDPDSTGEQDAPAPRAPDAPEDASMVPPSPTMTAAPEPDPPATGTGAGASDAPRTVIGAQESSAINANLAGLAAGTVRLAS